MVYNNYNVGSVSEASTGFGVDDILECAVFDEYTNYKAMLSESFSTTLEEDVKLQIMRENAFKTAWENIKKALNWLKEKIVNLITKIKNFFSKKVFSKVKQKADERVKKIKGSKVKITEVKTEKGSDKDEALLKKYEILYMKSIKIGAVFIDITKYTSEANKIGLVDTFLGMGLSYDSGSKVGEKVDPVEIGKQVKELKTKYQNTNFKNSNVEVSKIWTYMCKQYQLSEKMAVELTSNLNKIKKQLDQATSYVDKIQFPDSQDKQTAIENEKGYDAVLDYAKYYVRTGNIAFATSTAVMSTISNVSKECVNFGAALALEAPKKDNSDVKNEASDIFREAFM